MIRATHDTNVWIGGIRWRGAAYQVIRRGERAEYTSVTSSAILYELMRVLRHYFGFSDELAYEWYARIHRTCEVIEPEISLNVVERDPDDNKFVECAVAGRCGYIVSRDQDLLSLRRYEGIEIVRVEHFLAILNGR